MATRAPKVQRWIDLMAALLVRHRPATFADIARDIPAYTDPAQREDARMRMFERDKDELRSFGVPLETVDIDSGERKAYRLSQREFYLPYLLLATSEGPTTPNRVDRDGYRALSELSFEPEELEVLGGAAARVRGLGDPVLAAEAQWAMRKLAADLPVDANATGDVTMVEPAAAAAPAVLATLDDALVRRKRVAFDYFSMGSDSRSRRHVEPYGLFFVSSHWYLAARDVDRSEIRNFRVSRMSRVEVNKSRPQTPDFAVPAEFSLREHARSRQAWELGDDEAIEAIVEFRGSRGTVAAAARLGAAMPEEPARRSFQVRRIDSFARWLLSFAGDALPLSPPAVVDSFARAAAASLAVYESESEARRQWMEGSDTPPAPSELIAEVRPSYGTGEAAATQLRRILAVLPQLADGEEHALDDVAARAGIDVETLRKDLRTLVTRHHDVGGFVEGVGLFMEGERVSLYSSTFHRPMRLTASELCALELGLAMLATERPPDEQRSLESARERLRKVIVRLPSEGFPGMARHGEVGASVDPALLAKIRDAVRQRRRMRLSYRAATAGEPSPGIICPYALAAVSGMFYVVAYCNQSAGLRIFRADRIEEAELEIDQFDIPEDFSLAEVLRNGKAFHVDAPVEQATVHYSPRVARWIAEREGRNVDADGSLVLEHPVAEVDWLVGHVLQYGPDAEVLAPESMREAVAARLHEVVLLSWKG